MISDCLTQIGLKKEEVSLYETCLQYGGLPASSIAQKTGIPRTSVYVHAEKCIEKGFLKSIKKGISTIFIAADPDHLLSSFEKQRKKIKDKEDLIRENISLFQNTPLSGSTRPKVSYYEGSHYLETLYEKTKKSRTFYAYSNLTSIGTHAKYAVEMVAQIIQKNNLKAQEILIDTPEGHQYQSKFANKNHQIKFLPSKSEFHTDNIILDDRVFHVSYHPEEGIMALEIVSGAFVATQRVMFQQVWDNLK